MELPYKVLSVSWLIFTCMFIVDHNKAIKLKISIIHILSTLLTMPRCERLKHRWDVSSTL